MFPILHALQFVALRIRNEHATDRDPHMGRKYGILFFLNASILLFLAGLTISMIDISNRALCPPGEGIRDEFFKNDDDPTPYYMRGQPTMWQGGAIRPAPMPKARITKTIYFNEAQRTALAMMLTGVLYGILSLTVLLIGTNHLKQPVAGRAFSLMRLILSGLITIISTAIAMAVIAQKGDTPWATMAVLSGFLLVWGPTAFIHLMIMLMSVFKAKEKAKVDSDYYRASERDEPPAEREPTREREPDPEPRRPREGDGDGRRPTWKE